MFSSSKNNSIQLQFFGATALSLFTVASSLNCSFLGGGGVSPERPRSLGFLRRLTLDMLCVCAHVAARGTPQTSLEKTAGGEGRQDVSPSALQAHLKVSSARAHSGLDSTNTTVEQCQSR